jgi:uncharacterized membrane protein YfcA
MDYVIIAGAALATSALTLFSGFGLGTLLFPAFALFFPAEIAVAATAIVHVANNLLKASLFWRTADWRIVIRFGLPAIFAALLGAWVLGQVAHLPSFTSWSWNGREFLITPVNLVLAALMILFALIELLPAFRSLEFETKWLPLGGVLSGFFGGLSGHQGALRSAFLAKSGIDTRAFIGTNVLIALLVDFTRIPVYWMTLIAVNGGAPIGAGQWPLVITGMFAAFLGVVIGKRLMHSVTIAAIQILIGVLLLLIAVALAAGLI